VSALAGFCCQRRVERYGEWCMDTNIWGLICVPLGLLVCFGPALIATLMTPAPTEEREAEKTEKH
jgi:hypothetical protein